MKESLGEKKGGEGNESSFHGVGEFTTDVRGETKGTGAAFALPMPGFVRSHGNPSLPGRAMFPGKRHS